MLSVGPNSTCDVCLEPFGRDNKSPCSITCGHVFCATCLNHITRSNCPLCRTPFHRSAVVRLHVDLDSLSSPSPTRSAPTINATEAEQEARRCQDAIARIANQGSSEADLRKLLADTRAFLHTQPREKFTDLRVTHRMMVYLCDVKTNLIDQRRATESLNAVVSQLEEEKSCLRKQLETMEGANQKLTEEALWLRGHADKAQEAYLKLVDSYNDQVRRLLDLNEKSNKNTNISYSSQTQYSTPEHDVPDLTGVVEQTPDSYLISPLPQFTGHINSFDGTGLPDVSEEEEVAPVSEATPGPRHSSEPQNCGAAGHPLSCDCEPLFMFTPAPTSQETRYMAERGRQQSSYESSPTSFATPSASRQYSPTQEPSQYSTGPEVIQYSAAPEGSYDAPYTTTPRGHEFVVERSRSRSRSNRSRPISRGVSRAPSPTRPASPVRPVSYLSQSRATSSRDVNTPPVYPTPPSSGREGSGMNQRLRLQDILDSSLMQTSSLPSTSGGHFPSSYRERTPMPDDPDSSRPPSRGARRSNSDNYTPNLVRSSSTNMAPVPTPSPNPGVPPSGSGRSTASQAAAAIEERQRQERRERRKAEKERERLERERVSGDVQRSRTASNEEVYSNPNSSSHSSSHSRHTSTTASYNSWSGSGAPSSLREATTAHAAYQSRKGASTTPIPTSGNPGIYV